MIIKIRELYKKEALEPGKTAMWQLREILLNTDYIIRIIPADVDIITLKKRSDFKQLLELHDDIQLSKVCYFEGNNSNSILTIGGLEELYQIVNQGK